MRSVTFNNSVLVSNTCGLPAQNLFVVQGTELGLINTLRINLCTSVDKAAQQAVKFTQVYQLLCTVFQQILHTNLSVISWLVHIIHSAYKKHDELKKGIN